MCGFGSSNHEGRHTDVAHLYSTYSLDVMAITYSLDVMEIIRTDQTMIPEMAKLTNLLELDISENDLTQFPPPIFKACSHLLPVTPPLQSPNHQTHIHTHTQ